MKILIIDDDPVYQKLIQSTLEENNVCHIAADGQKAIQAFQKALDGNEPYDLMTLDIVMPGMNGRETLEAILKIESDHDVQNAGERVKVVITSSLDDTDNFMQALEEGCEAIAKPFTQNELSEKVQVCLGISKV